MERRANWRKVLYERQPFPDNYSGGKEFLKELRTNVSLVKYSFLEAACGACRVVLHEEAIVIYALVFNWMMDLPAATPYVFSSLLVIIVPFYATYALLVHIQWPTFYDHLLTLFTLIFYGYALTPIIRTLTDAISTDTIYAMSAALFTLSFIFHDYAMSASLVSTILSVNLSLAASICLVSRIKSDETAFTLLAISMALFSYWPIVRNELINRCPLSPLLMVIVICPLTVIALISYSGVLLALLQLALHSFVVVLCPWILVKMQSLKSTIHGPWDEACLGERST
uniref:Phosphatidylinositol N-acetylglucosaminyltransferase subunit C n=2 Tax=Parascaris univalens TaxID=6257 RepID=A0A915A7X7_PARUN